MVRTPSRAGIDPYDPIVDLLSSWMREHGLTTTVPRDDAGAAVGLTTEIRGDHPGPRWGTEQLHGSVVLLFDLDGRGVYRTQLHIHGTASHSGGSRSSPNAIDKAAHLIRELAAAELPTAPTRTSRFQAR